MRKKNGFICSRCGGVIEGKPVKIIFFISNDGNLTEEGLPEEMSRSIEENFCGVCAVKIRQAMRPRAEMVFPPMIKVLTPGYVKQGQGAKPAEKKHKGRTVTMEQALENQKKIVEMYRAGKDVSEIEKAVGLGHTTVLRHIHDLIEGGELEKREGGGKKNQKIGKEDEPRIYEMYKKGMSYDSIGKEYGVTGSAIAYRIGRMNSRKGNKKRKSGP